MKQTFEEALETLSRCLKEAEAGVPIQITPQLAANIARQRHMGVHEKYLPRKLLAAANKLFDLVSRQG